MTIPRWMLLLSVLFWGQPHETSAQICYPGHGRCDSSSWTPRTVVPMVSKPLLVVWYHPDDPAWQSIKGHFEQGARIRVQLDGRYTVRFRNCSHPEQADLANRQAVHGLTFEHDGRRGQSLEGFEELLAAAGIKRSRPTIPQVVTPQEKADVLQGAPAAAPGRPAAGDVAELRDGIRADVKTEIGKLHSEIDGRLQTMSVEVNQHLEQWNVTLAGWQASIDQTESNVQTIHQRQQEHATVITGNAGRVDRLTADLASLEPRLKALENAVARLPENFEFSRTHDVQQLAGQLAALQAQLDQLQTTVDQPFEVQLFSNGEPVSEIRAVQPHGGWLPLDVGGVLEDVAAAGAPAD